MRTHHAKGALSVTQILYSGLGGHASVAFSLISGDAEREWSSSLLFVGVEELALPYRQYCENAGLPFEVVVTRPGRPWLAWPAIYRALRRLAPDAIALHSINSLLPVLLYRLLHGGGLIAVEHTSNSLKRFSEWAVSALAVIFAQRVILLTEAYRHQYRQAMRFLYPARKVRVVPNGIDIAAFTRTESSRQAGEGGFRFGMAARINASKRQDLLLQALIMLRDRYPAIDWRLSLAGDGDALESLRQVAARAGVAQYVEFTGHLDERHLIAWFHTLDLYTQASRGETLSTAMLQAMAVALPIVGSDVPGITELLAADAGHVGMLVENTGESFAQAIALLQEDPSLMRKLAQAGRECVCRNYSQEKMFKSYNSVVQECLN